jgi:hypothetical protein
MNSAQRRPQYLDMFLLMHLDDPALASVRSAWRSAWPGIGFVLLVVFLLVLGLVGALPGGNG